MRCFRDPKAEYRWFVGDINVLKDYRRRKIASHLYDLVIDEVRQYEKSQYIEASVSIFNKASFLLHESKGFLSCKKARPFANFYFTEDEIFFRLKLYTFLPLTSAELGRQYLPDMWEKCLKKSAKLRKSRYGQMNLEELLEQCFEFGNIYIDIIWNGDRFAGLLISDQYEDYKVIVK